MSKLTLNFEKTIIGDQDITLDDIYPEEDSGFEEGRNTQDTPIVEEPVKETVVESQPGSVTETDSKEEKEPTEKEEAPAVEEPITLDDIYSDGEGDEEDQGEAQKELSEDVLLEGVRAVLSKKMERYGISAEGIDLSEMDSDALVDFEEELDAFIMKSKYDSIKSQVDPNVGKLWSFIENGGDPSQWKKLYESHEEVTAIDTSTDEGKLKKISSYLKEVRGWGPEQINKKLDRIKNTNTLDEEFEEVDAEYSSYFEAKQEELLAKQQEQKELELRTLARRKLEIQNELETSNLPPNMKAKILDVAFRSGKIKGTDKIVSVMDHTIQYMKSDSKLLTKLAHFLADPEAYDQFILQNKKNAEVVTNMKKGFEVVSKTKPVIKQDTMRKPISKVQLKFD